MTAFVLVREAAVDDDKTELVPSPLLDHQLTQVSDTYAVLTAFFLLRNHLGLAVFTEGGRDISELGKSYLPLVVLLLTGIDDGKWHIRLNYLVICATLHDLTTYCLLVLCHDIVQAHVIEPLLEAGDLATALQSTDMPVLTAPAAAVVLVKDKLVGDSKRLRIQQLILHR